MRASALALSAAGLLSGCATVDPAAPYEHRLRYLHEAGVGLWDVIGQCERPGSLDARIVRGSEVANPIAVDFSSMPSQVINEAAHGYE